MSIRNSGLRQWPSWPLAWAMVGAVSCGLQPPNTPEDERPQRHRMPGRDV